MISKKEFDDNLTSEEKIDVGLLSNHTHFLTGEIEEEMVESAIKWIVYENLVDSPNKVLTMYINSEGGNLNDAFGLIDIMKTSKYPIRTIGLGTIASAAFLIFASGTKGQRYIAKNTSIMSHQYSTEIYGKYHELKSFVKEKELNNKRMIDVLKDATGLDARTVRNKLLPAADVWLTAEELIQHGVADAFLTRR